MKNLTWQNPEQLFVAQELINKVKSKCCGIKGEKETSVYERFFQAGANRYLLRHETHNELHYRKLHPEAMSLSNRLRCLADLKRIGFQTGTGIMVGSPYQTIDNLIEDILYIENLQPEMIGIGPFLPHHDTLLQ